jgi:CheY-like chemotaxis protein
MKKMKIEKILVIEDLDKWQVAVARNLIYHGFPEPVKAYNADGGLRAYRALRPDLVITDINFDPSKPGNIETMEGDLEGLTKVCAEIRESDKEIPIVVMSSTQPSNLYEQAAIRYGADMFIDKTKLVEGFDKFAEKYKG